MLEKWFKGNTSEIESSKKIQEIELKHAELENKLLQSNVEIEQIKMALKETQLSLQLVLSSYQGLAEEMSTIYSALQSAMGVPDRNSFSFSFRDPIEDDDDDNWN